MTRSTVVQGVQGVLRIGQTMRILGRTGVGWAVGHRPPAPQLLRETFESLGATYIKLGQFIASSPTFFPTEYVDEFQHCLDQTPAIPYKDIRRILQEELKRPLESVYRSIEPVPLASASIAQVHAATLVTGEEVVIKVQKPGVETVLRTDLNGLYLATRLLETLAPRLSWTSISGVVDEIRSTMMEECDFVQEARNLETFRRFLKATSLAGAATLAAPYVKRAYGAGRRVRRGGAGIGRAHAHAPVRAAVLTQPVESPIISGSLVSSAGIFPAVPFPGPVIVRVPPLPDSRIPPWPTSSLPRSAPSRPSGATSATAASARSSARRSRR